MADNSTRIIALLEAIGVKRTEITVSHMDAAQRALEPYGDICAKFEQIVRESERRVLAAIGALNDRR